LRLRWENALFELTAPLVLKNMKLALIVNQRGIRIPICINVCPDESAQS
jgi:hypothetical protein